MPPFLKTSGPLLPHGHHDLKPSNWEGTQGEKGGGDPELVEWVIKVNLTWGRLKLSSVRENKVDFFFFFFCTADFAVWDLYLLGHKEIKLVYLCNQYALSEGQRKISKIVLRNNIIIGLSIWLPKGLLYSAMLLSISTCLALLLKNVSFISSNQSSYYKPGP